MTPLDFICIISLNISEMVTLIILVTRVHLVIHYSPGHQRQRWQTDFRLERNEHSWRTGCGPLAVTGETEGKKNSGKLKVVHIQSILVFYLAQSLGLSICYHKTWHISNWQMEPKCIHLSLSSSWQTEPRWSKMRKDWLWPGFNNTNIKLAKIIIWQIIHCSAHCKNGTNQDQPQHAYKAVDILGLQRL